MAKSVMNKRNDGASRRRVLVCANLILAAFLTHLYFIARYGFMWLDWDTATFTRSIEALDNEGTVLSSHPYAWGFGYQVIVSSISSAAGIGIQDLQQTTLPVTFGVVPIIIAIAFFRTIMGNGRGWIVATLLIILLPEIILTTSRGTHEKATIALMLSALMVAGWSLNPHQIHERSLHIGGAASLLMLVSALVFYNCFFALSFLIVVAIFIVIVTAFGKSSVPQQIEVFVVFGFVIWAGFVSLFQPASNFFNTATTYWERLSLILSGSSRADPYQGIEVAWKSEWLWGLTNLVAFFLIVGSIVGFIQFMRRKANTHPPTVVYLYVGATSVMAFYMALDFVGGSSITNLQIRWLPFWAVFAAPLTFFMAEDLWPQLRRHLTRRSIGALIVLAIVAIAPFTMMRATLDPGITSYWIFYDESEEHATDWMQEYCEGESWGGIAYRIGAIYVFKYGYDSREELKIVTAENPFNLSIDIESSLSKAQWERSTQPPLNLDSWNRVLDIGSAAIHIRAFGAPAT